MKFVRRPSPAVLLTLLVLALVLIPAAAGWSPAAVPRYLPIATISYARDSGALTDVDTTVMAIPASGSSGPDSAAEGVLPGCKRKSHVCYPAWTPVSEIPMGARIGPSSEMPDDLARRALKLLQAHDTVCTAIVDEHSNDGFYSEVELFCVNATSHTAYYRLLHL
jgi:hypothetical protein